MVHEVGTIHSSEDGWTALANNEDYNLQFLNYQLHLEMKRKELMRHAQ